MTWPQLPNYLRSNRKRLALSQEEVAFLLGCDTGQAACRHERFARAPTLATALAYEAIYRKSVRELFAGLYQKIEEEVAARAKALGSRKNFQKPNRQSARKRQAVANIAAMPSDISLKIS